ncbi:hypothetical protein NLI96_g4821 [Meripilus lineatus]|uniref:APC amino acid permease n=1 Tax=Meripilus lineatus TaxID=2056292 RepID=A0AAD5V406_9APHY|nr:hypothetical protein NLI96_g4821 [Physisporinus lineatus]
MNQDEAFLARLGYKQDFKRAFSKIELFGVSFSVIGILPSLAGVLIFAIPYGGPVAMVWGWTACAFFSMFIATATAELGSAAPTAGGLYYWTFRYAPKRWRYILSWLVGYTNTVAYCVGLTSTEWTCAVALLAGVSIGSDLTYTPTTTQTFGVFTALLVCHALTASMSNSILARLQGFVIACNILLALGVIIALPLATPKEFINSAGYAFGHFENCGLLVIVFRSRPAEGAFDISVHISEEASNASFAVPFATISSPLVALILGWGNYLSRPPFEYNADNMVLGINVAIVFCMGTDIKSIIGSPTGQPFAAILFNSFGQRGTLAVWSIVVFAQFFIGASAVMAASRQMWAFSRDGVLPFSSFLYRRNKKTGTPIYAVWGSALLSFIAGLMVFAGPVAVSAIFSACVVAQNISLSIPFLCRDFGGQEWVPGVFDLGRLGPIVTAVAVVWMAFSSVILCFPENPGPPASEMNYTVLVVGGWVCLCLLYYWFPVYGGMYWFKGPVANVGVTERGEEESQDEKLGVEVVTLREGTRSSSLMNELS